MNIDAKTEKELLKLRAAQAAYKKKVDTRWAAVGGRAKPLLKPKTGQRVAPTSCPSKR